MEAMLSRLRRLQREGEPLDNQDVEYWADRYLTLQVGRWAGVSFAMYLLRPDYYERIVAARLELARRRWMWHHEHQTEDSHAGRSAP